jgi:hypothetical protein
MPVAKPTQIVVHRIELQQSERQMLKEFVETRQQQQWVKVGTGAIQPVLIAGGVVGASYVAIRGYQALVAALNAFDPAEALKELLEPVPIIGPSGPIFGKGGLTDIIEDVLTGQNPLDDLVDDEGNPISMEDLQEANAQRKKDIGVLNTILYPFGITPFPKWL